MIKVDIQTRADSEILICQFYGQVRKHAVIGALFNEFIEDWEEHIMKLTDFWQTNLFFIKNCFILRPEVTQFVFLIKSKLFPS